MCEDALIEPPRFSILQICPCYVGMDQETGGVANVVRQLCFELPKLGYPVTLICGNRELGKIKNRPRYIQHSPMLDQYIIEQWVHPLLGPCFCFPNGRRDCNRNAVAHVHTCFSLFTESAMSDLVRRDVPFVFTPHGKLSPLMFGTRKWGKRIWWRLVAAKRIRMATRLVVLGEREAELFPQLGLGWNGDVVPNGYSAEEQNGSQGSVPLMSGRYVLFLGYLEARKQPGFLLDVFAGSRLRQTHKLVLAGPDAYGYRANLEKKIKVLGLEKDVVFWGAVYGAAKWNLFAHADCFCLPSLAEGMPVVLCEAIGAGIPVLYSKGCNFPEIARFGGGIELSEFEVNLWRMELERICLDEKINQFMRRNMMEKRMNYTWSEICRKWVKVYQEAGGLL